MREVKTSDAAKLFSLLHSPVVRPHYLPPPTLKQFEKFIELSRELRQLGDSACLTVVENRSRRPIGMFQLRRLRGGGHVAEWGFFVDPRWWGTRAFIESAGLVLDYAFDTLEVSRLEARVALSNARAAAALLKLGAAPEGILRRARQTDNELVDEALWAILRPDWDSRRPPAGPCLHGSCPTPMR